MVKITKVKPEFYSENGLRSFAVRIKNSDGSYRALVGKKLELTLYNSLNRESYKFATDLATVNQLTITTDNISDKINFPEIKSWAMTEGLHQGDLKEIDSTGFIEILQTLQFPFTKNFNKPI